MKDIFRPGPESDARGPALALGAKVQTTVTGSVTSHRVVGRRWANHSQSTVLFRVDPPIAANGGPDAWVDAAWFSPVGAM